MAFVEIYENIRFELLDGPVGVMVSGGVDSALLLYFVLKHSTNPVHIFTLANQEKHLRNPMKSIEVISKCAQLTCNYDFVHHITYDQMQNTGNLFRLPTRYFFDGTIKAICAGITKNPPKHITNWFNLPNEDTEGHERDPTVKRSEFSNHVYLPWTNLDKKDLARIYSHHGLMDTLFPVTRSCEWLNEHTHGPDPGLKHCGNCWWCKERLWGFERM